MSSHSVKRGRYPGDLKISEKKKALVDPLLEEGGWTPLMRVGTKCDHRKWIC